MSKPPTSTVGFWDDHYRSGTMPWDLGDVPAEVTCFLKEQGRIGSILVPGCGSAYEVKAFRHWGNQAIGIDVSNEAVMRARKIVGKENAGHLRHGDFFHMNFREAPFAAVYERAFHCALPPSLQKNYADRVHALLKPAGLLFGYFLYGFETEPPPYPMLPSKETTAFHPKFELLENRPSSHPLPLFRGLERWQVWRRR